MYIIKEKNTMLLEATYLGQIHKFIIDGLKFSSNLKKSSRDRFPEVFPKF